MKYVQILASTFAFAAAAGLLVQMRQFGHPYLYVVLFLLCGANLLSRLTETHIGDQIAEAEEKVAKRVLRRLAKVMPGLLDEYFREHATKPAEKLSDVITENFDLPAVLRTADGSTALVVGPKCRTERDATGRLTITAQPGCTAADVNAAVGAEIAH